MACVRVVPVYSRRFPRLVSRPGSGHARAIRDVVMIPAGLKSGRYVLGWRWDCEATAQVGQ